MSGCPRSRPGDARQRILDATVECFRAYGYEKSSMRLIANTAKVSQTLLHYHFETKEKLFDAAINDVATKLFAAAETQLMPADSVATDWPMRPACCTPCSSTTSTRSRSSSSSGAAANHNEFLRTAYLEFRDTQRRQFAGLLRSIAGGDAAPEHVIDESVRLMEVVLLGGMSMQRPPFASDQERLRGDFDSFVVMLITRLFEGLASG